MAVLQFCTLTADSVVVWHVLVPWCGGVACAGALVCWYADVACGGTVMCWCNGAVRLAAESGADALRIALN